MQSECIEQKGLTFPPSIKNRFAFGHFVRVLLFLELKVASVEGPAKPLLGKKWYNRSP